MDANDEFKIQLKVAGKNYPLYCKRSEEEIFRKAARLINDKIIKYSNAFADAKLEMRDLLVMASLQSFADNVRKGKAEDVSPLMDKIEDLNKELEEYLRSNS